MNLYTKHKNTAHLSSALIALSLLLMLFILPLDSMSQNNTSSPYSRYGLGEVIQKGFGQSHALGGIGIGLRSKYHLNNANPASYGALSRKATSDVLDRNSVIFEFGGNTKLSLFETTGQSQKTYDANFDYVALGFPIAKWLYSSIGLRQFSSIGYEIITQTDLGELGINTNRYFGSGGINEVYFANSFTLFKSLSIGINSAYLFGDMEKTLTSDLNNERTHSILRVENKSIVRDFYFDAGVQFFDSINISIKKNGIDQKKKLHYTVGVIFSPKTDIDAYNVEIATKVATINRIYKQETLSYDTIADGIISFPLGFGVGFTAGIDDRLLFGVDYRMQKWSQAEFFGSKQPLTDYHSVAAGMEFIPNHRSPKYMKQIHYRFGGHFSKSYLKMPLENGSSKQILDYGIHFGFGFPLRHSTTMLSFTNISFELGQRGTTDSNLIKESYALIKFNLSLHDYWFIKSKYR